MFFFEKKYLIIVTKLCLLLILAFSCQYKAVAADLPKLPKLDNIAADPLIYVTDIRILENELIDAMDVVEITGQYQNRYLTFGDLNQLSQQLTQHLIAVGYVNSGVIIPDQKIENGTVVLDVIEGRLSTIEIKNLNASRAKYAYQQLNQLEGKILNIHTLRQSLQLLEQDQRIDRIQAEIVPTEILGEAKLKLDVKQGEQLLARIRNNNYISPNVGVNQTIVELQHLNLTGHADVFSVNTIYAEGYKALATSYQFPLGNDFEFSVGYERSHSEVIAQPFVMLDIEGDSNRLNMDILRPIVKTINTEFNLGMGLESQQVESYLLGEPFSFTSITNDNATRTTVFSLVQSWLRRGQDSVIAFHSQFGVGIDAFEATIGGKADGEFITWLGQFSWANRYAFLNSSTALNATFRWANDSLPGVEKFSVGGVNSVRGYRESAITRDNGFIFSAEWNIPVLQIPLFKTNANDGWLDLTPFIDYGRGWNADDSFSDPVNLSSVGLRAHWQINQHSYLSVDMAHAFNDDLYQYVERSLQDDGLHIELAVGF